MVVSAINIAEVEATKDGIVACHYIARNNTQAAPWQGE